MVWKIISSVFLRLVVLGDFLYTLDFGFCNQFAEMDFWQFLGLPKPGCGI